MTSYDRSSECCPKCGGETHQDDVDIGVGVIYGPRGCVECGWSEAAEYDMTIDSNRLPDERGGYRDQFGGYHPAASITARAFKAADAIERGDHLARPAHAEPSNVVIAEIRRADKFRADHEAAVKALDGLPFVAVPIEQMEDIYARMLRLTRLGQSTLAELNDQSPEIAALKSAVFAQADFGAVFAGQWLSRESQRKVRETVKADEALKERVG